MEFVVLGEEVFDNTICANPPGPKPDISMCPKRSIECGPPIVNEVDVFPMSMFALKQIILWNLTF